MNIRQKLLLEFKKGAKPTELLKKKTASNKTIYNVWKQYLLYKALCVILWNIVFDNRVTLSKQEENLVKKVVNSIV